MKPIILASQSPRRKQLLEWAEIPFSILVPDTDESWPNGLALEDIPVYIARQKAQAVRNAPAFLSIDPNTPVLAADTIVEVDGRILGKPGDAAEALDMLKSLSGNSHRVITGVVLGNGEKEIAFADITYVHFHELLEKDLIHYIEKYKPFDKAGAYAIQEWIGVVGIASVRGDFYNVMGLPISRVVQELHKHFLF